MTNWLRFWNIVADPGQPDNELRCRFDITQHTTQTPNKAHFRITNPRPDIAQAFVNKEFANISLTAGYQDNYGLLFSGNIIQAIYGRESPTDTLLQIFAADADHGHNFAVANKSLAAGSTPQDHVNAAMAAMAPFGITPGFVGVDLSTPIYPRAVALFGMARNILASVAKTKGATVSYQNGQMQMVQNSQPTPGGAIILNSQTGLIGMPTQQIGGILARSLINPALKINGSVQIDQSLIQQMQLPIGPDGQLAPEATGPDVPLINGSDGVYKIYRIDISGDTRGNPWYMDLGCLAIGQAATSAAMQTPEFNAGG